MLRPAFLDACARSLDALARASTGLTVLVGFPGGCRRQTLQRARRAARRTQGRGVSQADAAELHGVRRAALFRAAATSACVVDVAGVRVGVVICEDLWFAGPARMARDAGAQVLVVPNGSPYHTRQQALRRGIVADRARETGLPIVYVNRVGGQDELVFDGASFVVDARRRCRSQQLPAWQETIALAEFDGAVPRPVRGELDARLEPHVYEALTMGVRDYVDKNRFPGVLLGLVGRRRFGADARRRGRCAGTRAGPRADAAIASTTPRSASRTRATMAGILGVRYDEIPIDGRFEAFKHALAAEFAGPRRRCDRGKHPGAHPRHAADGAVEQVRLDRAHDRQQVGDGRRLCDALRRHGGRLRACSRTSARRWSTALRNYRNSLGRVIPERIITRAPSAELRADQTDQDSLPPYDIARRDPRGIRRGRPRVPAEIVARGLAREHVAKVVRLIKINEYKRRQAAVGIRITPRGFGKDWRYPITSAWAEWKSVDDRRSHAAARMSGRWCNLGCRQTRTTARGGNEKSRSDHQAVQARRGARGACPRSASPG